MRYLVLECTILCFFPLETVALHTVRWIHIVYTELHGLAGVGARGIETARRVYLEQRQERQAGRQVDEGYLGPAGMGLTKYGGEVHT